MAYVREDQARVTVTIDGRDLGVFNRLAGGGIEADNTPYRPGGMAAQVSLGGPSTMTNVTVSRGLQETDDVKWLRSRSGKGSVIVVEQLLDADGNAFGAIDTFTGVLNKVEKGDYDANGNDPRMLELEIAMNFA